MIVTLVTVLVLSLLANVLMALIWWDWREKALHYEQDASMARSLLCDAQKKLAKQSEPVVVDDGPLKVGDVVKLSSGGPLMAVHVIGAGVVECDWFDDDEALQSGNFVPECLVKKKA